MYVFLINFWQLTNNLLNNPKLCWQIARSTLDDVKYENTKKSDQSSGAPTLLVSELSLLFFYLAFWRFARNLILN